MSDATAVDQAAAVLYAAEQQASLGTWTKLTTLHSDLQALYATLGSNPAQSTARDRLLNAMGVVTAQVMVCQMELSNYGLNTDGTVISSGNPPPAAETPAATTTTTDSTDSDSTAAS